MATRIVTARREITLADIEHFAAFTGDTFYAHMDEDAARGGPKTRFFDGRVAPYGYLIVSFAAGLFVQPDPGPVLAKITAIDNLRFLTPVYPGDTLGVGADLQGHQPARRWRLWRGPLGGGLRGIQARWKSCRANMTC